MQDIDELMQLAVDGAATPAQQADLRAMLERSPEARAEYEALQTLARQLDAVPSIDPPNIKPAVMETIVRHSPAAVRTFGKRRTANGNRRRLLAFAYAAVAIIIVVIAFRHAAPPSPNSSASMVRPQEELPVVASVHSAAAIMTIRGNGQEFVVDVTTNVPYSIDWDHTKLLQSEPNHFRRQPDAHGPAVIRLRLPDNSTLTATIDLH